MTSPDHDTKMKLIRYESGVLKHLQGIKGIPEYLGYFEDSGFEIMKLEYLGNDLETILRLYGKVSTKVLFTLKLNF
jgi:hypothetical protein